jgi:hypothetical protein
MQRPSAFERLRLMPLTLPDFVRNAKQLVDTLRSDKHIAVVIGEDNASSTAGEFFSPLGE